MFLKFLTLIIFLWFGNVSGNRVKRHLVFNEGSRLFFSVDIRDNLFNYSNFFANVFGFKIDWDLPSEVLHGTKKGKIHRRSLYQGMEQLLYKHNINGTFCIRKFLCEAKQTLSKNNHFLAQLYEVIFSSNEADEFGSSDSECVKILAVNECPLTLMPVFLSEKIRV